MSIEDINQSRYWSWIGFWSPKKKFLFSCCYVNILYSRNSRHLKQKFQKIWIYMLFFILQTKTIWVSGMDLDFKPKRIPKPETQFFLSYHLCFKLKNISSPNESQVFEKWQFGQKRTVSYFLIVYLKSKIFNSFSKQFWLFESKYRIEIKNIKPGVFKNTRKDV